MKPSDSDLGATSAATTPAAGGYKEGSSQSSPTNTLGDDILAQAQEEFRTSFFYKAARVRDWHDNEDLNEGRSKPMPQGRFNVVLPIMSGYLDHLKSKIDDQPALQFGNKLNEAKYMLGKLVTEFWTKDSGSDAGRWAQIDRWGKDDVCMYGRAVKKIYASSLPKYKSHLYRVDPYDFYPEPHGGGYLERHRYMYEDSIFIDRATITDNTSLYDAGQAKKLFDKIDHPDTKNYDNERRDKSNRESALGLPQLISDRMGPGQEVLKFTEGYTIWHGVRYYILFQREANVWIRCCKLTDIFESNLWPYVSWGYKDEPSVFWNLGPADIIRPVAEASNVLFNQALENRQKKNFVQRAYDPAIFPDPSELIWRPDGLARANAVKFGRRVQDGVYEFQVGEVSGTLDLMKFMDDFTGQKTGINQESQGGSAGNQRVGIHFANLQQASDMIGLRNKAYVQEWIDLGRRYLWGCIEHMPTKVSIKIAGEEGSEWQTLKRTDLDPDMDITITGGSAEEQATMLKAEKRQAALTAVNADPILAQIVNSKWRAQEMLRTAEYSQEEINVALDTTGAYNEKLMAECSQAIQDIIAGETPKLNRAADPAFYQKIMDFIDDEGDELDFAVKKKLYGFAAAHVQLIIATMRRRQTEKLMFAQASAPPGAPGMAPGAAPGAPAGPGQGAAPALGIPGASAGGGGFAVPASTGQAIRSAQPQ